MTRRWPRRARQSTSNIAPAATDRRRRRSVTIRRKQTSTSARWFLSRPSAPIARVSIPTPGSWLSIRARFTPDTRRTGDSTHLIRSASRHFRKTNGYANLPLDGIWLRAPYLHNGSVPNLRELLEPAAARTKLFYRGNDVFDPQNVGFVSNVAELNGHRFFAFDTTQAGNGNGGHEGQSTVRIFRPTRKRALLEYLKTF